MGIYSSTKCGSCGEYWQFMENRNNLSIGPPYLKCRKCLAINKTKQILWRDANLFKKIWFLGVNSIRSIFFGCLGLVMFYAGISKLYEYFFTDNYDDYAGPFWLTIITLLGGFMAYKQFIFLITANSQFKVLEDLYDKNGGFIWSDEMY